MKVGKEYDVTISETSQKSDGTARILGFVIFVARAKSGGHLKINITEVGNRFAKAHVLFRISERKREKEG